MRRGPRRASRGAGTRRGTLLGAASPAGRARPPPARPRCCRGSPRRGRRGRARRLRRRRAGGAAGRRCSSRSAGRRWAALGVAAGLRGERAVRSLGPPFAGAALLAGGASRSRCCCSCPARSSCSRGRRARWPRPCGSHEPRRRHRLGRGGRDPARRRALEPRRGAAAACAGQPRPGLPVPGRDPRLVERSHAAAAARRSTPRAARARRRTPEYRRAIAAAQAGGARVLGYVPTAWGARPAAEVEADIDRYRDVVRRRRRLLRRGRRRRGAARRTTARSPTTPAPRARGSSSLNPGWCPPAATSTWPTSWSRSRARSPPTRGPSRARRHRAGALARTSSTGPRASRRCARSAATAAALRLLDVGHAPAPLGHRAGLPRAGARRARGLPHERARDRLWARRPHGRHAELYDAEYAKQLERIARIRSEVSASAWMASRRAGAGAPRRATRRAGGGRRADAAAAAHARRGRDAARPPTCRTPRRRAAPRPRAPRRRAGAPTARRRSEPLHPDPPAASRDRRDAAPGRAASPRRTAHPPAAEPTRRPRSRGAPASSPRRRAGLAAARRTAARAGGHARARPAGRALGPRRATAPAAAARPTARLDAAPRAVRARRGRAARPCGRRADDRATSPHRRPLAARRGRPSRSLRRRRGGRPRRARPRRLPRRPSSTFPGSRPGWSPRAGRCGSPGPTAGAVWVLDAASGKAGRARRCGPAARRRGSRSTGASPGSPTPSAARSSARRAPAGARCDRSATGPGRRRRGRRRRHGLDRELGGRDGRVLGPGGAPRGPARRRAARSRSPADERRVRRADAAGALIRLDATTRRPQGAPVAARRRAGRRRAGRATSPGSPTRGAGTVRAVDLATGRAGAAVARRPRTRSRSPPTRGGVYVVCRGDRTLVRLDARRRASVRAVRSHTPPPPSPSIRGTSGSPRETNEVIRVDR